MLFVAPMILPSPSPLHPGHRITGAPPPRRPLRVRLARALAAEACLEAWELVSIRWCDVNLDAQLLAVRGPWGAGRRRVALTPRASRMLARAAKTRRDPACHLFRSARSGGALSAAAMQRILDDGRTARGGAPSPLTRVYRAASRGRG